MYSRQSLLPKGDVDWDMIFKHFLDCRRRRMDAGAAAAPAANDFTKRQTKDRWEQHLRPGLLKKKSLTPEIRKRIIRMLEQNIDLETYRARGQSLVCWVELAKQLWEMGYQCSTSTIKNIWNSHIGCLRRKRGRELSSANQSRSVNSTGTALPSNIRKKHAAQLRLDPSVAPSSAAAIQRGPGGHSTSGLGGLPMELVQHMSHSYHMPAPPSGHHGFHDRNLAAFWDSDADHIHTAAMPATRHTTRQHEDFYRSVAAHSIAWQALSSSSTLPGRQLSMSYSETGYHPLAHGPAGPPSSSTLPELYALASTLRCSNSLEREGSLVTADARAAVTDMMRSARTTAELQIQYSQPLMDPPGPRGSRNSWQARMLAATLPDGVSLSGLPFYAAWRSQEPGTAAMSPFPDDEETCSTS